MIAQPKSEAFLGYNKLDGYVPTLVGNWVEVREMHAQERGSLPTAPVDSTSAALLHCRREFLLEELVITD
jgi:hypothetical protein